MSEEFKKGYVKACQNLNEEIEIMIHEVYNSYIDSNDRLERHKLDAQMKILHKFKSKIESAITE